MPHSNNEEEKDDVCDNESIPRLFTRNDDDSSDDDDDSSEDESIINDNTTVSANEFDDDINVVIKDVNGDQCYFLLCPSLNVNLVKQQYFELVGLNVDQQRMLFRDKMMSDNDSIHSHGVMDGSIVYLVRRLRGGARTKRRRIKVVSTLFQGHDGVSFG